MFFMGVYKDQTAAQRCLSELKHFYPDEKVVVISDGIPMEGFLTQGADVRVGSRLKTPNHRGSWTARFLLNFLGTRDSHVIKIDPDTHVNRRVEIPKADIFSAYRYSNGKRILAGPAIGFSRKAAMMIMLSGFLYDSKYSAGEYAYHRFYPPRLKEGEEQSHELVSLQDDISTDVVNRLNIETLEWSDISLTDPSAAFYHSL